MKPKTRGLFFQGTAEDGEAILNRIIAENPGMTLEQYLDKYHKDILILN